MWVAWKKLVVVGIHLTTKQAHHFGLDCSTAAAKLGKRHMDNSPTSVPGSMGERQDDRIGAQLRWIY